MDYTILYFVTGFLLFVTVVSQQQEGEARYVTLGFLIEDGTEFSTPCSSMMRQTQVMAFNVTKVKTTEACICHVQMGKDDQFLNIEALNGSTFNTEEELAVYPKTTDEFHIGISPLDDIFIRIQDKDEEDLYESHSDSLMRMVAKPGPTISIECHPVAHESIRFMYGNSTNSTIGPDDLEPVDITGVIIGIVIGLIVLIILATLLIFVIQYIKRDLRRMEGTSKHRKPGTDYVKVPEADTDEVRRRYPPRGNNRDSPNINTARLLQRSDPNIDIETSFGGARPRGPKQHPDLDIHDDSYRAKASSTPDISHSGKPNGK